MAVQSLKSASALAVTRAAGGSAQRRGGDGAGRDAGRIGGERENSSQLGQDAVPCG